MAVVDAGSAASLFPLDSRKGTPGCLLVACKSPHRFAVPRQPVADLDGEAEDPLAYRRPGKGLVDEAGGENFGKL